MTVPMVRTYILVATCQKSFTFRTNAVSNDRSGCCKIKDSIQCTYPSIHTATHLHLGSQCCCCSSSIYCKKTYRNIVYSLEEPSKTISSCSIVLQSSSIRKSSSNSYSEIVTLILNSEDIDSLFTNSDWECCITSQIWWEIF